MSHTHHFLTFIQTTLALVLLAGCATTSYIYSPPASDQGRFCVTQCAGTREACRGNEMQRAQHEKASCERSSDTTYRACMAQPVPREREKEKAQDCEKKRKSCWSYEDTSRCETNYRECFVNCGGVVEEHIDE